jgi:hypothetical protein
MATADVTEAQFQTELGAVKTAIAAQDWAGALLNWALAKATAVALNNSMAAAGKSFSRMLDVDSLLPVIERARDAANGGLGQTSVMGIQFQRTPR